MLIQITKQQTTDKFNILKKQWADCEDCQRHNRKTHFRGTMPAPVLFLGGYPSLEDHKTGFPISGKPGEVLDKLISLAIEVAGLPTLFPYAVANLVACYDPANERLARCEVEACEDRITQLRRICNPQLIVLLGRLTAQHFNVACAGPCPILRTHHPELLVDQSIPGQDRTLFAGQFVSNLSTAFKTLSSFTIENAQAATSVNQSFFTAQQLKAIEDMGTEVFVEGTPRGRHNLLTAV